MKCIPISIFITMVTFILSSCSEDAPAIDPLVIEFENTNAPPRAKFTTTYPFYFTGEKLDFKSTSTDSENDIKSYKWNIQGVEYFGKDITVNEQFTSDISVTHIVVDANEQADTVNKVIEIINNPNILIRIVEMQFGNDIGDGQQKGGDIYFVNNSFSISNLNDKSKVVQNTLPVGAPSDNNTFKIANNSRHFLGYNSGMILYEGEVHDFLGISLVVIDHDKKPFNWTKFIGDVFSAAGTIIKAFEPTTGTIVETAGKVTSKVGELIEQNPEDDIIGQFSHIYTINDRWGIGGDFYMVNNNVSIKYHIELLR